MDKLNELIDFYEMTEDEPELLVMLLELRRHRQENWKQRAEAAWAEAKHQLGVNVVLSRHNQAIVDQRDKALTQLSELARQEPVAEVNHDGTFYGFKALENMPEGNYQLFTRPAPAAVPDGWKLVPLQPTDEMIQAWRNDMSNSYASQYAENIGEDEIVFAHQAMLAVAPEPPAC